MMTLTFPVTQPRISSHVLPLSLVTAGETVELIDIREQDSVRQRLAELGLTQGTLLRVIQTDPSGGMILAIRQDARLAIGRSTAHKIIVSFTSGKE
jgi:Fe2+ transport system protein FeoA